MQCNEGLVLNDGISAEDLDYVPNAFNTARCQKVGLLSSTNGFGGIGKTHPCKIFPLIFVVVNMSCHLNVLYTIFYAWLLACLKLGYHHFYKFR